MWPSSISESKNNETKDLANNNATLLRLERLAATSLNTSDKVDVPTLHPSSSEAWINYQEQDHNNASNHAMTYVTMFSPSRDDRSGTAITDMLKAHAYVWSLAQHEEYDHRVTLRYGGACGTSKHADDYVRLIRILGLQFELPYNAPQCPPPRSDENDTATTNHTATTIAIIASKMNDTLHHGNRDSSHSRILLPMQEYQNFALIANPKWLQYLQRQRQTNGTNKVHLPPPPPEQQQQLEQHVVIHMRRGDVSPCYTHRYLPNSYYLALLDQFAPMNSSTTNVTRVTIFTESPDNPNHDEGLQAFIDRGMTLITCHQNYTSDNNSNNSNNNNNNNNNSLNSPMCHHPYAPIAPLPSQQAIIVNADLEVVWNIILHDATVVILSKSLFSYVPALFSIAHTIAYTRFFFQPLSTWYHVQKPTNLALRRLRNKYCA